jgi:nucleoside-diphosphate-sugar epimerase
MMILLTGASGFVGGEVLRVAQSRGIPIRPVFRSKEFISELGTVTISSLTADTNWRVAVSNVDVVIHCAARVHIMDDQEADPLKAFREVNVQGTLNLARQSAEAGVKRFIFISSVKVNGEGTQPGRSFKADDIAAPEDAYGISKAEAEVGLRLLSDQTGMEVVIIRPPLVYGPGVKGNFSSMLSWIARGLPLPFGAVTSNLRSFIGLDNLVDLILTCVDHPNAANQTFLVSDGEDLSTTDLLRKIGLALNQPVRLIPVPIKMLSFASSLLGKRAIAQRLLGSLQVDISKTRTLLEWSPSFSVDEELLSTVKQRLRC